MQQSMKIELLQKKIMMVSSTITFCFLSLICPSAYAAKGFAGMMSEAAQQSDSIKTSLGVVFAAVGFAGVGYGAYNLWRKGKEGENSQITVGKIFVPMLGGAALAAVSYMLTAASESVGIQ